MRQVQAGDSLYVNIPIHIDDYITVERVDNGVIYFEYDDQEWEATLNDIEWEFTEPITFGRIDEANSDEEHLYIDMPGIGTVMIQKTDEGLVLQVFHLHVVDEPVLDTWVLFNELIEDVEET